MRSPDFEASLADAKAYPQLWRLALGLVLTAFMALTLGGTLIGAVIALANWLDPVFTIHISAGLRSIKLVNAEYR